MTSSLLEAFDLVAHSEQLALRLEAAVSELGKRPGLAEEKAWLSLAHARVVAAREGVGDLVLRALRLPELEPVRPDHARVLQGAAVDALERLHAGITFAGGARAPLLEALYYKLKTPALRRCDRKDFEAFWRDFEKKRLQSTYARRIFAEPSYAVVAPALEQLHRAVATFLGVFDSDAVDEATAQALRAELTAAASRLELPCRQGRLLAQAALVPLKELLESSSVASRPKRRTPRVAGELDEDTHAVLEQEPPDPHQPSEEERAELAALEGATT
jgi:hypothetical protein